MVREIADEELLARTSRGEVPAFEAFYRRWMTPVLSYHRRATGSAELALELTAETFAAVVASVDASDPERGTATPSRTSSASCAPASPPGAPSRRGRRRVGGLAVATPRRQHRDRRGAA